MLTARRLDMACASFAVVDTLRIVTELLFFMLVKVRFYRSISFLYDPTYREKDMLTYNRACSHTFIA